MVFECAAMKSAKALYYMAFNRWHAQHTSWLVPLCLDGAFN